VEAIRHLRQATRRLRKVVGDARAVRITDVRLLAKRHERRPRLFEASHPGHDVDDWLGSNPGDRCGADVMDPALQPRGENMFQ
jgi:hypothetical protein